MKNITGLLFFWLAADFVASLLSPDAGVVVGFIILTVLLTVLGSELLSWALAEKVNPVAGFMLAFPGWLLTEFVFHWHLSNPAAACDGKSPAGCGIGVAMTSMLINVCIVGVGMAIVSIPAIPLILKLRRK